MEPFISIVEDDESARAALRRMLISHGFTVTAFASAEQFLASDQPLRAACLIADISMPGISGLGLHRRLLEAGYRIPTILITGRPSESDRDAALGEGVLSYLPKPFSEQTLLEDIRSALGRPRQPDASARRDSSLSAASQ